MVKSSSKWCIGFLFHMSIVQKNPLFQVYVSQSLFVNVSENTEQTAE
jgi:hypothetical protein